VTRRDATKEGARCGREGGGEGEKRLARVNIRLFCYCRAAETTTRRVIKPRKGQSALPKRGIRALPSTTDDAPGAVHARNRVVVVVARA